MSRKPTKGYSTHKAARRSRERWSDSAYNLKNWNEVRALCGKAPLTRKDLIGVLSCKRCVRDFNAIGGYKDSGLCFKCYFNPWERLARLLQGLAMTGRIPSPGRPGRGR